VKKSNKRVLILSLCALTLLIGLALFSASASHSGLGQGNQSSQPKPKPNQREVARGIQEFEARFPTTDYESPEPTNPEERTKRRDRNKHYDGRNLVMRNPSNSGSGTVVHSEVFYDLPGLPVAQSDVILTADVLNSEAHLSNDKTGVYSEFGVQVEEVLKGGVSTLSQSNLITLSRFGGMVRYPSGHKELYAIAQQNMPTVGRRYLLFLKKLDDTYEIVTGYEIGSERVLPLDDGLRFEAFRGTEEAVFLNTVRDAIANKN
jgi:hypothetical protein